MKTPFLMNSISCRWRSLTASLLCVSVLLSDLPAQAQSAALSISPKQVTIPADYGRVEESRQTGSKTIIFIQDAHDSLEAQENIAALISHLVETAGIKTVFEEGYEGPVPADDYFGRLEDPEVREKVSYYLLDQLRIGGAEYAHINRRHPFELIGGDDARLHRENIEWYRKTARHQAEALEGLRVLQDEITRLANRYFPAELKEWMKLKARFDQEKISFWDYLQRLRETGGSFFQDGLLSEVMGSRYPTLARLYRAARPDLSRELHEQDLDAEALFRETSGFENDIADELITHERDRMIFGFYKTLELLRRLNSLEVSFEEYRALRGTLPKASTEDFARFISLHAKRSVSLSKRWEENIRNALKFYETAGERDRAVEKKLEEFKADKDESSAILVFGGFHRGAIREILREQGFSYQIISPVISQTQDKHRQRYRNLMTEDYEARFLPSSVSNAARALSDIAVAELSDVYKERFGQELDLLSRAAMTARNSARGDLLLSMQQELKKEPERRRSELRAESKSRRPEKLTQEKLEEEVRRLGETSLEIGGNDRTGWAVSTEKRHEHDRLHALERTLSERFKGYRFSYYHDVRTDQNFKRLDILPPLASSRRSELRSGEETDHRYVPASKDEWQSIYDEYAQAQIENETRYMNDFYRGLTRVYPELFSGQRLSEISIPEKSRVFHEGLVRDENGVLWILKKYQDNALQRNVEERPQKNFPRRERFAYLMARGIANLTEVRLLSTQEAAAIPFVEGDARDYYLTRVVTDSNMPPETLAQTERGEAFAALFVTNVFMRKYDQHLGNVSYARGIPVSIDHDETFQSRTFPNTATGFDLFNGRFFYHTLAQTGVRLLKPAVPASFDALLKLNEISRYLQSPEPPAETVLRLWSEILAFHRLGDALIDAEGLKEESLAKAVLAFKSVTGIREMAEEAGFSGDELEAVAAYAEENQKTLGRDVGRVWQLLSYRNWNRLEDLDARDGAGKRSELRALDAAAVGAFGGGTLENLLWLLAVPAAVSAGAYLAHNAYLFWTSRRLFSALAQGARYIARGSYTHVLQHANFPGYVLLVKRHPFVMKLKQGEAIRSPQITEKEEWQVYKALRKLGMAPFTRYAGKFSMKDMRPERAGVEGEDVFLSDQKKLKGLYDSVSSAMSAVSVYLQEEGVPLNRFVREQPDQKSLADKSLAEFSKKLWKAGWIDLDIGRRNYLLVTDRKGQPVKDSSGLFRLKVHDFGAIMPIPEDLERFMTSRHRDSDVTNGFFFLRNLTATVRAAGVLFPRLDLKAFHEISKAADEAAEAAKARGDKAAFRDAYLSVIHAPKNKEVITRLSLEAARHIQQSRSEMREGSDDSTGENSSGKVNEIEWINGENAAEVLPLGLFGALQEGFPDTLLWPKDYLRLLSPLLSGEVMGELSMPGNRILIYGPGAHTLEIRGLMAAFPGAVIYAADIARENLKGIQKMLDDVPDFDKKRLKLVHADFKSLPFPDDFFDVMYSKSTFDISLDGGVDDYYQKKEFPFWIAEARRVMKPRGVFFAPHSTPQLFLSGGFFLASRSSSDDLAEDGLANFIAVRDPALLAAVNRSELRSSGDEGRNKKRAERELRIEAEKKIRHAKAVFRKRITFIGFASSALIAGGAVYWMLPKVPAQQAPRQLSEAVVERQRFAAIRGVPISDSTKDILSQQPELIDAIAEGYDAADRVRKSQIEKFEVLEAQQPAAEGQSPAAVFQVQPHTPLDVAPPFEPVQIRRDAEGRANPIDLQEVRNSVSGGRIAAVAQVQEWIAWLPFAAIGLMAILAYAFLKGVRRVDTGSIMDVKNASDRSVRDISKLRAAAEKKKNENEDGQGRSELRVFESGEWGPLKESIGRLLELYPVDEGKEFYDLVAEKGFFQTLRQALKSYLKAEEALSREDSAALDLFREFQGQLRAITERLEVMIEDDHEKLTEFHPGAANATFGVLAVQLKPEVLKDETPRQFSFGSYSLKQLVDAGILKVDLRDGAVVAHLPDVKGILSDRYPEVMREELEKIQRLLENFLQEFPEFRSELRTAAFDTLKGQLRVLIEQDDPRQKIRIFNEIASALKGGGSNTRASFKELLSRLLDNQREERALYYLGIYHFIETDAGQRARLRRLYEHLYDGNGRMRSKIPVLTYTPPVTAEEYGNTFTVRIQRKKETLRIEKLKHIETRDQEDMLRVFAPYNVISFLREVRSGFSLPERSSVYVIRNEENLIVAYAWSFMDPSEKLLGLAASGVSKAYRGKGLGTRLLVRRLEDGLKQGMRYAKTSVGDSGRASGWHWRLMELGAVIDSLKLVGPLPEIAVNPQDERSAREALQTAQRKPYPENKASIEKVLKKYPGSQILMRMDLSARRIEALKGIVLKEAAQTGTDTRSELRHFQEEFTFRLGEGVETTVFTVGGRQFLVPDEAADTIMTPDGKILGKRVFSARSELRAELDEKRMKENPAVEKMTVPAAVFLDARELIELKEGQADERFDELLTLLERHPAFDLYIDHGDRYPVHNLSLPKLRQILSEFPERVHFGELSRANLAKKKVLIQISFFEDAGDSAQTRKLIQDIQRRYRIQSDLLPVEYLLPGALKGFLDLAESFTQAELIREIGEAYATRSAGGRWRLAADFAASLWARIQNDYVIQWSA